MQSFVSSIFEEKTQEIWYAAYTFKIKWSCSLNLWAEIHNGHCYERNVSEVTQHEECLHAELHVVTPKNVSLLNYPLNHSAQEIFKSHFSQIASYLSPAVFVCMNIYTNRHPQPHEKFMHFWKMLKHLSDGAIHQLSRLDLYENNFISPQRHWLYICLVPKLFLTFNGLEEHQHE